MNEYKRENATLEARIEEIQKRSTYHDDHIRIADGWVLQVSNHQTTNSSSVLPYNSLRHHADPASSYYKRSNCFVKAPYPQNQTRKVRQLRDTAKHWGSSLFSFSLDIIAYVVYYRIPISFCTKLQGQPRLSKTYW